LLLLLNRPFLVRGVRAGSIWSNEHVIFKVMATVWELWRGEEGGADRNALPRV
jgi:hypothetical protein